MDIEFSKTHYASVAVSYTGDGSDITILAGPNKGRLSHNYASADLIKIDDKIIKQIYYVK